MQSINIILAQYQAGGHGKFGNGAIYQDETLRGPRKRHARKPWLLECCVRGQQEGAEGISYNKKTHSAYFHSKIDPSSFRNESNPTFMGKPSNRHEWHIFVIFNH